MRAVRAKRRGDGMMLMVTGHEREVAMAAVVAAVKVGVAKERHSGGAEESDGWKEKEKEEAKVEILVEGNVFM